MSRPRTRYSMNQHGHDPQSTFEGAQLIRHGEVSCYRPKWGEGGSTLRILPGLNYEDPNQFDAYRYSAENLDFGDWIRMYPAVRSFGDPGLTMIIHDPANGELDKNNNPAWVLYNAINDAVSKGQEQGPGWGALLKGSASQSAQLPKPSSVYLVQALIMRHGDKVHTPPKGWAADDRHVVIELSSDAGRKLLKCVNEPLTTGNPTHPQDWDQTYTAGDIVSVDKGKYVTFYKLADGDPRVAQTTQTARSSWDTVATQNQQNQRDTSQNGWGVYVEDSFQGLPPQLAAQSDHVRSRVMAWEDILHFPSVEKQAALIADKFKPEIIMYAWKNHQHWIPDSVRAAAQVHTTANVGFSAHAPQTPPADTSATTQATAPAYGGQTTPADATTYAANNQAAANPAVGGQPGTAFHPGEAFPTDTTTQQLDAAASEVFPTPITQQPAQQQPATEVVSVEVANQLDSQVANVSAPDPAAVAAAANEVAFAMGGTNNAPTEATTQQATVPAETTPPAATGGGRGGAALNAAKNIFG